MSWRQRAGRCLRLGRTRVDGAQLALGAVGGKERRDEELRKAVKRAVQVVRRHLQVVVGVFLAREGVGAAAVLREICIVVILARILWAGSWTDVRVIA